MFRTLSLLVQAVLSIYGSVYAAYASRILNERKVSISIRDVGVNTMLYFKAKNNHLPLWIMYEPAAKAMARDAALSAVSAVLAVLLAADSASGASIASHDYAALLCAALLHGMRTSRVLFFAAKHVGFHVHFLTAIIWLWAGFGIVEFVLSPDWLIFRRG